MDNVGGWIRWVGGLSYTLVTGSRSRSCLLILSSVREMAVTKNLMPLAAACGWVGGWVDGRNDELLLCAI